MMEDLYALNLNDIEKIYYRRKFRGRMMTEANQKIGFLAVTAQIQRLLFD